MLSPLVRYSILRLLIFAAVLVVLGLLGARGWLLVLLAAVVSLAVAYLVLGRMRDEVTASLVERSRARQAGSADEDVEDAQVDAADTADTGDRVQRERPGDDEPRP